MSVDAKRSARTAAVVEWLPGLLAAALLLFVYLHSPQRRFFDSKYALITSQALLEHGDLDLSPYLGAQPTPESDDSESDDEDRSQPPGEGESDERASDSAVDAGVRTKRLPYQIRESGGRILYIYSPGVSILSAPLLPLLELAGYSATGADGRYDSAREIGLQAMLAAWLSAGSALLLYRIARRELPPAPAALLVFAAGLGSGLWSVASRVVWTHSWSTLLIAAAWLELLRWEDGQRRRGVLLGFLMVALFWVRPTGAVVAAAVTVYVLLRHRRALLPLVATGAVGLVAYGLYSLHYWGAILPRYFKVGRHLLDERPRAFLVFFELLVSPGHGLIAFSPLLLLVAWWLARYRWSPDRRAFARFTLATFLAFVLLYSRWGWGGTVGPRFLCDPTALLAWLGAHGWRRAREVHPRATLARRAATAATALALFAASAAAHGGVAWDLRRVGGPAAAAADATPRPRVPYLQRGYWKWRGLPQLQLPEILDALEQRRNRPRRGARPAAAPPVSPH